MGTLSMTASDLHTKYHWPPARSSDLLGDCHRFYRRAPLNSAQHSLPVTLRDATTRPNEGPRQAPGWSSWSTTWDSTEHSNGEMMLAQLQRRNAPVSFGRHSGSDGDVGDQEAPRRHLGAEPVDRGP